MKKMLLNKTLCNTLLVGLLLVSGPKALAQIKDNKPKLEQMLETPITNLAGSFLDDPLMQSLSIAIYYKGGEFVRHFGELDKGKNNKPRDETIYDIGSVTKTFVGTLIAQAELEGVLSIEDDVRDYLDGDYANLQYKTHPIKIKHLLTHTSGLPRFLPLSIAEEFNNINAEFINRIAMLEAGYSKQQFFEDLNTTSLQIKPGTRYQYSNAGAELAAYILEKAYGMPFESLLEEKLFNKANMTSTLINLTKDQANLYANGYDDFKNKTPPMEARLWGGSGHAKSSVTDLLSYMKFHLGTDEMVVKSQQILFDKDLIHTDPRIKLGYMWEISTDGDFGQYVNHHGGAFGTQNWMMVFPDEALGISVVTNHSGRHTAGKLKNVINGILSEIAKHKYASTLSETEQITETLMDYIEGSTAGQPQRLKKAFHPDLNLYYIWAREFRVWSGKEYIEDTKEGEPTGEVGKILSIDYENDIATAKIQISNPKNGATYIDYLMLMKVNGSWIIVHKMFTKQTQS